jgi:hypothetical protein
MLFERVCALCELYLGTPCVLGNILRMSQHT